MALADLLPTTVEIYEPSPGPQDDFGVETETYALTATTKGRLEFNEGVELQGSRLATVSGWRLFLGPAPTPTTRARLVVAGREFDVDTVAPVYGRSGVHHQVVTLTAVGA